jgi:hypothetical protein
MSRFSGSQGKGAMRRVREEKRQEAEARDAALPLNSPRRRRNRLAVSR